LGTGHLSPSRRARAWGALECVPLNQQRSIQVGLLTLQIFGTIALFLSHLFVIVRNRFVNR